MARLDASPIYSLIGTIVYNSVKEPMQYLVIIEKGVTSYGAYVPDLPGCVAIGETKSEVENLITEAIQFHIGGLREDGVVVPPPSSTFAFIDVAIE